MPLAFPSIEAGSFFSTSLVEIAEVDFIDLYIPVNPFSSITRRVVPAAAVFSVTFGIALIGVENKQSQLEILVATSKTLTRIAMMVIKLTPIGVFAIAADAASISDPSGKRPNFSVCVILFKYLLLCPGYDPVENDWVSFKDFRDSSSFAGSFVNYTEAPIVKIFLKTCHTA